MSTSASQSMAPPPSEEVDEPLRVTLVCSAAATGLSAASQRLAEVTGLPVGDLDTTLVRDVVPWSDYLGEPQTMATLCAESDRDAVLAYWTEAYVRTISDLKSRTARGQRAVLACHLTLFSPTRLEFYAPPLAACLLTDPTLRVDRVIVLIDDIYDMFARLSRPSSLLHGSAAEHEAHARKLTGPLAGESELPFTEQDLAAVQLESQAKDLLRLLHWRRSEMVAAEELSRNLSVAYERPVPLTVLAVKHEMEALVDLVSRPDAKTVYVSHKITEPRLSNIAASATGVRGQWLDLVEHVNLLASSLRSDNVLCIQPTAIDELRFMRDSQALVRIDRYTADLADRWPLMDDIIYETSCSDAPDFRSLLSRADLPEYSRGTLGLLQHSIYDEIAFRDHLLVSCNDGLLVYRPGAVEPRISGGVEEEVRHWAQSVSSGAREFRPAVFVHVREELIALIDAGDSVANRETLKAGFISVLAERSSSLDEARSVWDHLISGQGVESALRATAHLRRQTPGDQATRIRVALDRAFVHLLAAACKIDSKHAESVAHFVAADPTASCSRATLRGVAALVNNPTPHHRSIVNASAVHQVVLGMGSQSTEDALLRLVG